MSELKDANTNPWYVLMTLYGEQERERVDWELAEKNRKVWNAWACQELSDEERARVCASSQVEVADTLGWSDVEAEVRKMHRAEMVKRNSKGFSYTGFPDFDEAIRLSEIRFSNPVELEKRIFTQVANFRSATFTQAASFRYVIFMQNANFPSATFTQGASFDSAIFRQDAYFYSATFTQNAEFPSATFTQGAYFFSAIFRQDAYFHSATFRQDAKFRFATFEGPAKFVGTRFGLRDGGQICVPDFTEAVLAKLVSFRKAEFPQYYPVLAGAVFSGKVIVTADKAFWPSMDQVLLDEVSGDAEHTSTKEVAKESSATLRHEMGRQGLPEEEHFFFRREMEFARQLGLSKSKEVWPYFKAWPYWIFKTFSGYGESITRPLIWLGIAFVTFAVMFSAYFNWMNEFYDKAFAAAAPFTLSGANLFSFLGFHRFYFSSLGFAEMHWFVQFLCAVEEVMGLVLLFFLGLGLRKRFRLR